MPRRHDDQAFGSDSFLDVVANVVGILIILLVVVGVRVSRAPVTLPSEIQPSPSLTEVEPELPPAPPPVVRIPVPVPPVVELEPLIIDVPAPPPPEPERIVVEKPLPALPAAAPPRELVDRSQKLQSSLAALTATRQQLQQQLSATQERTAAARSSLESAQQSARTAQSERERVQRDVAAARAELSDTLDQLARLKEGLDSLDAEPAATTVQHRINPLGKAVSGPELHFYLSKGCVAHVPVEQLAARLKLQIERQKEMLARMDRYEGSVDPIDGFRMQFVIQKSRLSFTEEMKFGPNLVRMQVSQWVLLPEPGLALETAEQAMQRGSRFYQSLLAAGPGTSLTFWVYPDAFDTCAKLKEFAHRHGYEVAARPLPFGVPIAGSPEGSKSVAQ